MDGGSSIVVVLSAILGYLIWDTYYANEVEYITSTIDNNTYLVRSLPDKRYAADLLAQIREKLETFMSHMSKNYISDERVTRLIENFRPDRISEGSENAKYTSYSINKGEKIVLCLRSRDEKKQLVDLNTMMFVVLHEIAHLATKSIGHTAEFWDNFKWILKEAVNIGIYKSQDFNNKPVEYCGIQITDNPLNHGK
jgi:predicted metal-dependent hydrolase